MRERLAPNARGAYRYFALTIGRPRQEQAGHVGAGDQQHHPDCAEQQVERVAHLAHGRPQQRGDLDRVGAVVALIPARIGGDEAGR